jgi:bacteriorhodopsin
MLGKSYQINFIMFIAITMLTIVRSFDDVSDSTNLQLQLSSFVTFIASMHYFLMIVSNDNVVSYRYFDWFFTTPVLLIDLCLILGIYDKYFLFEIVIYNCVMLLFGYLGEINVLSMLTSTILGFIPFVLLFYKIYNRLKNNKDTDDQKYLSFENKKKLLLAFVTLWSLYGLNNIVKNLYIKNLIYNILDFITKGAFGLFIYSKSL